MNLTRAGDVGGGVRAMAGYCQARMIYRSKCMT